MQLEIFDNFSKRQNSTKRPAAGSGRIYEVYMKDQCSVLHPVFLIDGIDLNANYCRWVNRFADAYYYIDDIVLSNNNIYELRCSIDVLATWKSSIGASSQYVLRSASVYDGRICDTFYPMKKECTFITTSPSTTDGGGWATAYNSGIFVVGLISDGETSGITQGSVTYVIMSPADFKDFASVIFTDANWTGFQQNDRYNFNPIQYVASVMWFPKNFFGRSQTFTSLKLGWQSLSGFSYVLPAYAVGENTYTFSLTRHPQAAARGFYLNCSPYSQYRIVFPPFGDMDLDPDVVADVPNIVVTLKVDLVTGNATLIGRGVPDNGKFCELFRRDVQLGVSVRLSQIAADRIGAAVGVSNSVGSFIGNILAGNPVGAVTGVISGVASAYESMFPSVQNLGSNDCMAALMGSCVAPVLNSRFYEIVDEENAEYGRPVCSTYTISQLSGYILCAHAEISINGLPEERDEIVRYMNSGFFYE